MHSLKKTHASSGGNLTTFLAELLADQRVLDTPVARFSSKQSPSVDGTAETRRYSELIPLSLPKANEQYAFEVDLDSCTGCKACVAGCHSLNGLDEDETWRDVGLLVGKDPGLPFQQTVTTACHHCADPACLNGCPVSAYEKDPTTGIVRHLDDQCIGCQYCILKCPYDVPKYSERLGIVRKCDMCHSRLAAGEAPACVQACPTQAISIVTVTTHRSSTRVESDHSTFLPFAPDPEITQPTTRYLSARPLPTSLRSADISTLRVQCAHTPLVTMLVFTQIGLGLLCASAWAGPQSFMDTKMAAGMGFTLFVGGLIASVAHLGQPLRAWRVFLNLRRSWLSREAIAFGSVFPVAALVVAGDALNGLTGFVLAPHLLTLSVIVLSAAAIACSAMIYVDTKRAFWSPVATFGKFFGTTAIAGSALLNPILAVVLLGIKLAMEAGEIARISPFKFHERQLSARLLRGPLLTTLILRSCTAAGAIVLFLTANPTLGFCVFVLGEFLERTLFFQAAASAGMPGLPEK